MVALCSKCQVVAEPLKCVWVEGLSDGGILKCNALYDWEISGEISSIRKGWYSWRKSTTDKSDPFGDVIWFKQYA